MNIIVNHWQPIALLLVFLCGGAASVWRFLRLGAAQQRESVRGWLLQAVLWAEGEFGSRTGRLKLSSVYAAFCQQLPWLAKAVPFARFSGWVDEALAEMRVLLEQNEAIAEYVVMKEVSK